MERNLLLISGKISEREIKQLAKSFAYSDHDIEKYIGNGAIISGIHDIVSLIFKDFNPIGFARDYILGKIIDLSFKERKAIISWLLSKNKVVDTISILKEYQKMNGDVLLLDFTAPADEFDLLIEKVIQNLSVDLLETLPRGNTVYITLDINKELAVTTYP